MIILLIGFKWQKSHTSLYGLSYCKNKLVNQVPNVISNAKKYNKTSCIFFCDLIEVRSISSGSIISFNLKACHCQYLQYEILQQETRHGWRSVLPPVNVLGHNSQEMLVNIMIPWSYKFEKTRHTHLLCSACSHSLVGLGSAARSCRITVHSYAQCRLDPLRNIAA